MLLSAEEFFSHVSGELNVEADVADVLTIVGGIRYCLRIENDVPTFKWVHNLYRLLFFLVFLFIPAFSIIKFTVLDGEGGWRKKLIRKNT